jgi:hypothetical protein
MQTKEIKAGPHAYTAVLVGVQDGPTKTTTYHLTVEGTDYDKAEAFATGDRKGAKTAKYLLTKAVHRWLHAKHNLPVPTDLQMDQWREYVPQGGLEDVRMSCGPLGCKQ